MLKVIVLTVCASLAVANVQQARSSQPSPVGMQATKDEASKEEVVNPLIVGVLKHLEHDDFNLKKRVEKLEHEASVVSPVVAEAPETGAGVEEPTTAGVEEPMTLLQEKTTTTNNLRKNQKKSGYEFVGWHALTTAEWWDKTNRDFMDRM